MVGDGLIQPKFAEDLIDNDGMVQLVVKLDQTYDEILYDHQWLSDGDTFIPGRTAFKETILNVVLYRISLSMETKDISLEDCCSQRSGRP